MIYLIKSAAFIDNTDETEIILKIGYVGDDKNSQKARESCYLTENPTCCILFRIPEGDKQDEANLHYRFSHLKKSYGREWFEYNDEILKFFETHTTKESLQELEVKYSEKKFKEITKQKEYERILFNRLVNIILSEENPNLCGIDWILSKDVIVSKCEFMSLDELKSFIIQNYQTADRILKRFENSEKLDISEFNQIKTLSNRIEFLKDKDSEYFDSVLPKFRDYYTVFGYDKLKALQFNEPSIIREWNRLMGNSSKSADLKTIIHDTFMIGSRYSLPDIKSTISMIYSNIGYQKTPKATDLEEYFEVKKVRYVDKATKERVHGFEILSKK